MTYQVGLMRASGAGIPKSYITLRERYKNAIRPAFSGALSPAIARSGGLGPGRKVYRIEIL